MTDPSFVTLVLDDLPAGAPRELSAASLVSARSADAARLGARVRCFAASALDPKADVAAFVTIFEHATPTLDVDSLSDAGVRRRAAGTYALRNVMPGSERAGSVDDVRGILLGLTDCSDPERLGEFNTWYDESHAADVIRSKKYQRGSRFESVSSPLGRFLALYETRGEEPDTFKSYFAWPERDRSRCEVFVIRQVLTLSRL